MKNNAYSQVDIWYDKNKRYLYHIGCFTSLAASVSCTDCQEIDMIFLKNAVADGE